MSKASGTDPLGALHHSMALSSLDWGASGDTAWIYGIAVGWDGPAMAELAAKFGWSEQQVKKLRKLRRYYRAAELAEERRRNRNS